MKEVRLYKDQGEETGVRVIAGEHFKKDFILINCWRKK